MKKPTTQNVKMNTEPGCGETINPLLKRTRGPDEIKDGDDVKQSDARSNTEPRRWNDPRNSSLVQQTEANDHEVPKSGRINDNTRHDDATI